MNEQMKKDLPTWESEYLSMVNDLSKREKEFLQGADIRSHEGMVYGRIYQDWKVRKGYEHTRDEW